jgi:hypothetical protein
MVDAADSKSVVCKNVQVQVLWEVFFEHILEAIIVNHGFQKLFKIISNSKNNSENHNNPLE